MNVSERLKNLENYASEKEKAKQRKIEKERKEEMEMIKQIKSLKPRIEDLLLVGNSCLSTGIYIGKRDTQFNEYKDGYFLGNPIAHRLGFDTDGYRPIHYLEIPGGGYDNYNLKTNGVIVDLWGDKLRVLKQFLNEFDEFEKEFYAYVDKFIASNSK